MTDFSGVFSMMKLARNSSLGNECCRTEGRVTGWVRGEPPICVSLIRGAGLMAGPESSPSTASAYSAACQVLNSPCRKPARISNRAWGRRSASNRAERRMTGRSRLPAVTSTLALQEDSCADREKPALAFNSAVRLSCEMRQLSR